MLEDITQLYEVQLWKIEHAPMHERVSMMRENTESTLQQWSPQSLCCSCKDISGHLRQCISHAILCFSKEGGITVKLRPQ